MGFLGGVTAAFSAKLLWLSSGCLNHLSTSLGLDPQALHEAICLPLPSAGRANTGEGKRRCQSRLCTSLWDEGCSAGTFQKFAVLEVKFD